MIELYYVRILIALIFLSIASYQDIKTRHISDIVWFVMITFGCFFILFDVMSYRIGLTELFFVLMLMIVAVVIYKVFNKQQKESFGGADMKAFIAIAILLPIPFIFGMFPFSYIIVITAELFAFAWYFPQALKIPKEEWNTIKFPLIPFLLFGLILAILLDGYTKVM